ncbi:MAG: hypothetical protein WCB27_24295 [Thermoguttaceae bacterium]|jgi:membrane protease YdiL (CAAX protease family)
MKALERVVYPIAVLIAFAYGLVGSLLPSKNAYAEIDALLGHNALLIAAVAIACAALSAATMYIFVRVTPRQPAIMRFSLKCFVLMLPAVALGLVASIFLAAVGVCKIAQPVGFLAVSAAMWLVGGIAGGVAFRTSTENGPGER